MGERVYDIIITERMIADLLIRVYANQMALQKTIHAIICNTDQEKEQLSAAMNFEVNDQKNSLIRSLYEDYGETPDLSEMLKPI